MSWPSWLVVLFASVLLIPGAFSIEVGFSAGNGGESADLSSSYDVDTGVSVSEESTANPDQATIENTRSVSGTGDINAVQTYSGSRGYVGSTTLSSQGVSGSLKGNAILTPQTLAASQEVSLTGNSVDTSMGLINEGDSADLGIAIKSGSIDSNQFVQTGSVHNALSATINAPWGAYSQFASLQGMKDSTTMTLKNSKMQPYFFNSVVDSHSGAATGLGGCYADLDVDKQVEGNGGSKAEIHAIVTNPSIPYNWNYIPSFSGISQTLTAQDADFISAEAYATNDNGDQSKVGVYITDGTLYNYRSSAYFSGTKATSYQEFYRAEGNEIRMNRDKNLDAGPIPVTVGLQGIGSNSYAEISGEKSQVIGYLNSGSAERISARSPDSVADPRSSEWIKTTSYQKINYAEGNSIDVGTQAFDNVGGESANAFSTVKDGSIFLYSDSSTADLSPTMTSSLFGGATALADINAVGSLVDVQTNAKNTKYTKNAKKTASFKLSASLGSEVDSDSIVFTPTVYPWKGLAIIAARSNAVKHAGHVGVGVWKDDGTWTIGAVENPSGSSVLPGSYNGGWQKTARTWLELIYLLNGDDKALKRGDPELNGDYDKIKIIHVSDPHPDQANTVMDDFRNRGFWIAGFKYGYLTLSPDDRTQLDAIFSGNKYWPSVSNDCLDASVDALRAYGATNAEVPPAWWLTAPNYYFANLNGEEYTWNSEWKTYSNTNVKYVPDFPQALPTEYNVNPGDIIQDYIKKAKSGDTITISPGIFNENLVIDKSLTLQGAGKGLDGTIVDGQDSGSVIRVINDKGIPDPAIEVNLFDLLIRNGLNFQGGGIYNLDKLNIEDCTISGNDANVGGGIYSASTVTIKNSEISGNTVTKDSDGYVGNGGGIFNDGGVMTITDSTISKNKAANDGGGVYNGFSSHTTYGGTTQIIDNEATTGYGGGIYSASFDTYDGTGVAVKSNKANLPDTTDGTQWYQQYGVYGVLPNPTNGFDPATQVTDNTRILNLHEWSVNAGELIQSYIDKAISGDTITISPGIFNENLVIDKSLTLKGAGSTESGTIVDGMGKGSVITIGLDYYPNIEVSLKDMIIRNGLSAYGGGIKNYGTLNLEDCVVSGNTATIGGGGILEYSYGTVNLYGSTSISGNTANGWGGGIYNTHGLVNMYDSSSIGGTLPGEGNTANAGGGISNSDGGILNMYDDSSISGNTATTNGGGIINYVSYENEVSTVNMYDRSSISGNTANGWGGGIYTFGDHRNVEGNDGNLNMYDNCFITGNIAGYGGGIYSVGGTLLVGGSSQITKNQASTGYGGGIWASSDLVTFDGAQVVVKFNKAKMPGTLPAGTPWYKQYGVYMDSGIPTMINGFDPTTQVTENTRILKLPEWGEVSPVG